MRNKVIKIMKYRISIIAMAAALLSLGSAQISEACTNIIVTKGASKDGSVMVTYAADSHTQYGELYHHNGGVWPKGTMIKVYEWDSGRYLMDIPQAARTYSTMGNMNEFQLIITETTFGGLESLVDTTGGIDYGSIIYLTLQRAKTAREAIKTIAWFLETYGYCSEGESFSIADKDEAWIMEIVGKGVKKGKDGKNLNKGANWVAIRIPDGYISGHANCSRISTFPLNDPENCLYSKDIVKFAKENGYYDGPDNEFSFCDAFAPASFGTLRGCETRVWSFFNILGGGKIGDKDASFYVDYAAGKNPANKMPLYIKPSHPLTVKDVADAMRDHFEDTPFDFRYDLGAGPYQNPYRWRPMSFVSDGKKYEFERSVATQQTGFWLLGQARGWLPDIIGGIIWFGVDDTATSSLTPVYSSGLEAPLCFRVGNGSMTKYSETSAFWLFNRIANFAYSRYMDIAPEVRAAIDEHENGALRIIPEIDANAQRILNESKDEQKVKAYLTDWSNMFADRMFKRFKKLDEYLLVKYMDGNIKKQNPDGSFQTIHNEDNIVMPAQPGYPQKWLDAIAKEMEPIPMDEKTY